MPRSETGTTSSDSSDSSSFDDDSDWNDSLDSDAIQADMAASDDDEAEFGPDEPPGAHLPSAPPATESVQREMEFELKRQSFVEELAKQLCRIYLEQELRSSFPVRQAAAQLREFWRRHPTADSRSLQCTVVGFLSEARGMDLEHMVAALRCMLEEPIPDNDLDWILGLDASRLPLRPRLQQAIQQAIVLSLCDRVGREAATMVATQATELAFNTFSIPALRLLWPLLDDTQRGKLQLWIFQFCTGTAEEPTERASSSSQKPRFG